jgi:hypothetical protein
MRPRIFIRAENGYSPDGWLGKTIGRTLWLDCFNAESVKENFPKISRELDAMVKADADYGFSPGTITGAAY